MTGPPSSKSPLTRRHPSQTPEGGRIDRRDLFRQSPRESHGDGKMLNPSGSNRFLALTPKITRPQYLYTRSSHGLPYPWNERRRISQCSEQTLSGSWSSPAGSAVKPVANLPTRFLTVLVSSQHSELSCRSPRSNTCSGKRLTEKGGGGFRRHLRRRAPLGATLPGFGGRPSCSRNRSYHGMTKAWSAVKPSALNRFW